MLRWAMSSADKPAPARRFGPLTLIAVVALAVLAVWVLLEVWLHLLGIAASPLSWLLSLLGTIASAILSRGG